ncbi:MAG TPA: hypothetical protein VGD21_06720 [Lysobacter sp.]
MRQDLSTAMASGAAITVASNNVTIDCNDFKLGGLAAGITTTASGIMSDKVNVGVRRCRARGFRIGIESTGAYALVEQNRLDLNTFTGIRATGEHSIVRANTVLDTGGRATAVARGIDAGAPVDIIDNIIAGVASNPTANLTAYGVLLSGGTQSGSAVKGNHIRGLVPGGSGTRRGIALLSPGIAVRDNIVALDGVTGDIGVLCSGSGVLVVQNMVIGTGAGIAYSACADGGGNASD